MVPDQAVWHYLQQGAALGLSPGPLFDGPWYLANNPDVAKAGLNPLLHYLDSGHVEGRPTCPVAAPELVAQIGASDLFDAEWYQATQAPEVGLDKAAQHYLQEGAARGLSPSSLFDGPWYLANNPDVAAAGLNPLLHYLDSGIFEKRPICPVAAPALVARIVGSELFDAEWYQATQAPDVALDRAAQHYLHEGAARGLSPSPLFDGPWYLESNPDVAAAGQNPLLHYLMMALRGAANLPLRRPIGTGANRTLRYVRCRLVPDDSFPQLSPNQAHDITFAREQPSG